MENLSISIYLGGKVMDNMKEMRNKVQDGKYNLTLEYPNVEVFCGTNLPMLVEATLMLSLGCDIDSESIKESGVNSIKPQPKKVIFTEDGI